MPDTLLTIKETAALLKMTERTVYAMAKEGRLPGAAKVGGSWRVMRNTLMSWLEAGGDSPRAPQPEPNIEA